MSRASEIIVVDDDTHLREMIEEYLRRFAFAVRGAANGSELDLRLAAARPDLIILDVNMPAEDGFTILRRVRESDPRLGILMLTAAGAVESRIDALRAGADDYLVKPFLMAELEARILALVRRSRWHSVVPSMPGSITSSTMASKRPLRARCRPSCPVRAWSSTNPLGSRNS